MTTLTCAAPDCDQPRSNQYHCSNHVKLFQPKYVTYKLAETSLVDLKDDLQSNDPMILLRWYSKVQRVYDMRAQYRKEAFRKEYWDSGHEFRLQILLEMLIKIERRLSDLFDSQSSEDSRASLINSESTLSKKPMINYKVITTIRTQNKHIIDDELSWSELIPTIILENEALRLQQSINNEARLTKHIDLCLAAVQKHGTILYERVVELAKDRDRIVYYIIWHFTLSMIYVGFTFNFKYNPVTLRWSHKGYIDSRPLLTWQIKPRKFMTMQHVYTILAGVDSLLCEKCMFDEIGTGILLFIIGSTLN